MRPPPPAPPRRFRPSRRGVAAGAMVILAIGIAAGAASISPVTLAAAIAGGAPGWLAVSALLNAISHTVGGVVWHRTLRAAGLGAIGLPAALRAHWICRGASELLPLQIGEAARVVALRREPAANGATWRVIGSIAAMKLLDVAVTLPLVALILVVIIDPDPGLMAMLVGLALAVVAVGILVRRGAGLIRLIPARARDAACQMAGGAAVLRSGRALTGLWSLQAVSTVLRIAGIGALLVAYGAPLMSAPAVFALLAVTGLVPLVPGGAGVREAAVVPLLVGMYGLGLDTALAASLAVQAVALGVAMAGAGIAMAGRARVALPLEPAPSPV